ncbi:MFS transporter [Luteimonas aquatica]|uniref:MFS transporter n=1 Tax=Luteimonas aquatica TaxID=450364 RepID=UPI001F5A165F|nr:MFS transporter [Luteimonas aquatica]
MSSGAPAVLAESSPLRNRGFVSLMVYRICTMLSYQIVAVTVGWHVYEVTRQPFALGLIGLAEVLPYFCVAPFAGYLVDHLPRRKLGMAACLGLVLTPLLLMALTAGLLPIAGVWPIYAAIALTGMVRAFLGPVYNALFARVLPREQFTRGASLGSVVFQAGLVIGPALGGALVGWAGKAAAYGTGAGIALLAVAALASMRVTEPPQLLQRAPIFASIGEGLRFVFGNQIMLGAMALDMFSVLLGGAVSMLPAFIHDILHHGPEGLGILRGAPALGSILVALWLARHPLQKHAGRVLLVAVACFGLCTIAFALSRHFWLSAAILVAYGMCDGVSVVMRSTIMQLVTPDDMRGRVSSINGIFIGSSNELGAFYDGVMARLIGLVPAVIVGGCVTLGVVGVTAWRAPRLRRLDLRELQ